jgi:hypothetical protein
MRAPRGVALYKCSLKCRRRKRNKEIMRGGKRKNEKQNGE